MVAIITPSPSLNNAFNYNENKVKAKAAECIMAANYPKDLEHLGDTNKLNRLKNLAALNQRTENNAIHITLNFHPTDVLDKEKMKAIAGSYMEKIGFGEQPYLVYVHKDAGHPHMHIVTTQIQENGIGINMNKIGILKSEPAREQLEEQYGLVRARGRGERNWEMSPIDVKKVVYGKVETKKAIADVVNYVSGNYKFSSIAELNAILKLYNVIADRGEKDSRIYKNNGLIYQVLDEDGKKIGVPIKSSSISTKPTLKKLEVKFKNKKKAKEPFKQRIRGSIDWAIMQNPGVTLDHLGEILKRDQIQLVTRQNEDGIIYGMTFVDHKNKVVINGRELGDNYSANSMRERVKISPVPEKHQKASRKPEPLIQRHIPHSSGPRIQRHVPHSPMPGYFPKHEIKETFNALRWQPNGMSDSGIFNNIVTLNYHPDPIPYEYLRKKKKKKKKRY